MKKFSCILRLIKSALILFPILVSACSPGYQPEPILSPDGKNTGLLTNINCSSDEFYISIQKQKAGLLQVYRNGEIIADSRLKEGFTGDCQIGEYKVRYTLRPYEKSREIIGRRGSWSISTYDSPSYLEVQKNGTETDISKIHLYFENNNPSIYGIKINREQLNLCYIGSSNNECYNHPISEMEKSPFNYQVQSAGVY